MDISNVDSVLNQFSVTNRQNNEESENDDELGRDVFLQLLTTQLQNQNPLEPQENSEFVAQLAQFTQVESLDELSNNFSDFTGSFLSNQALAASSLVGTSVTVPSEQAFLTSGGVVSGRVELPTSSPDVNVSIFDDNGSLIDRIPLGEQPRGELLFRWDGTFAELNGELIDWQSGNAETAPGEYRIEVTALIDGESTQLDTGLSANVNSVTVGNDGQLTLNLAGIGSYSINDVMQFNQ